MDNEAWPAFSSCARVNEGRVHGKKPRIHAQGHALGQRTVQTLL